MTLKLRLILPNDTRPHISVVVGLMNHTIVGRTRENIVSHEPKASNLQALRVFYKHPALFIEPVNHKW